MNKSFVCLLAVFVGCLIAPPVRGDESCRYGTCTYTVNGTVLNITGGTTVGDYNFCYDFFPSCRNFTDVIFASTITTIGQGAFDGCGFRTVHIPATVQTVNTRAFANCKQLTSVVVEAANVYARAFAYCDSLTSVSMNSTDLGSYIFVESVHAVVCYKKSTAPTKCYIETFKLFDNNTLGLVRVYVLPSFSGEEYFCSTGVYKNYTACNDCRDDEYYDSQSKSCKACSTMEFCTRCIDGNTCTECAVQGMVNKGNKCECPAGQYYDYEGNKCVSCSTANPVCEKCYSTSDGSVHCTVCRSDHYLIQVGYNKCVPCSTLNSHCIKCNKTTCKACEKGMTASGKECACASDEYFDTNNGCTSCKNVNAHCTKCDNATTCTECEKGMIARGNECACLSNEYFDTNSGCTSCRNVNTHCTKCDNATTCTECNNGGSPNDGCRCGENQYEGDDGCLACSSFDVHCSKCSGARVCTVCVKGFHVEDAKCVADASSSSSESKTASSGSDSSESKTVSSGSDSSESKTVGSDSGSSESKTVSSDSGSSESKTVSSGSNSYGSKFVSSDSHSESGIYSLSEASYNRGIVSVVMIMMIHLVVFICL